jgi:hypothetical protein
MVRILNFEKHPPFVHSLGNIQKVRSVPTLSIRLETFKK